MGSERASSPIFRWSLGSPMDSSTNDSDATFYEAASRNDSDATLYEAKEAEVTIQTDPKNVLVVDRSGSRNKPLSAKEGTTQSQPTPMETEKSSGEQPEITAGCQRIADNRDQETFICTDSEFTFCTADFGDTQWRRNKSESCRVEELSPKNSGPADRSVESPITSQGADLPENTGILANLITLLEDSHLVTDFNSANFHDFIKLLDSPSPNKTQETRSESSSGGEAKVGVNHRHLSDSMIDAFHQQPSSSSDQQKTLSEGKRKLPPEDHAVAEYTVIKRKAVIEKRNAEESQTKKRTVGKPSLNEIKSRKKECPSPRCTPIVLRKRETLKTPTRYQKNLPPSKQARNTPPRQPTESFRDIRAQKTPSRPPPREVRDEQTPSSQKSHILRGKNNEVEKTPHNLQRNLFRGKQFQPIKETPRNSFHLRKSRLNYDPNWRPGKKCSETPRKKSIKPGGSSSSVIGTPLAKTGFLNKTLPNSSSSQRKENILHEHPTLLGDNGNLFQKGPKTSPASRKSSKLFKGGQLKSEFHDDKKFITDLNVEIRNIIFSESPHVSRETAEYVHKEVTTRKARLKVWAESSSDKKVLLQLKELLIVCEKLLHQVNTLSSGAELLVETNLEKEVTESGSFPSSLPTIPEEDIHENSVDTEFECPAMVDGSRLVKFCQSRSVSEESEFVDEETITNLKKVEKTFVDKRTKISPEKVQPETSVNLETNRTPGKIKQKTFLKEGTDNCPEKIQRKTFVSQVSNTSPQKIERKTFVNQATNTSPEKVQRKTFASQGSNTSPKKIERKTFANQATNTSPEKVQRKTFASQGSNTSPQKIERKTFVNQATNTSPEKVQRETFVSQETTCHVKNDMKTQTGNENVAGMSNPQPTTATRKPQRFDWSKIRGIWLPSPKDYFPMTPEMERFWDDPNCSPPEEDVADLDWP